MWIPFQEKCLKTQLILSLMAVPMFCSISEYRTCVPGEMGNYVSRSLKQDLCQPMYIHGTVFLFRVSTFDFRIAFKLQSSQQHKAVLPHKPLLKTSAKFRNNLKQLKLLVTKFWRQRKVTTTFVNFNKLNQAPETGYEMALFRSQHIPFLGNQQLCFFQKLFFDYNWQNPLCIGWSTWNSQLKWRMEQTTFRLSSGYCGFGFSDL